MNTNKWIENKLKSIVGNATHTDWFMELEDFIQDLISKVREEYRQSLKQKIEVKRRVITAWFRRYGQTPKIKSPEEMEKWIKNTEDIGYNQALDDILKLLEDSPQPFNPLAHDNNVGNEAA